jgi:VanZ family protein
MPIAYILLTGLYCFLIFENSAVSEPIPVDMTFPLADKLVHVVMYGGLCGVVSVGMSRPPRNAPWLVMVVAPVLFATAYGLTDEIHQFYVPGRSCEIADLFADFLGACLVQLVLVLHWRRTGHLATFEPSEG